MNVRMYNYIVITPTIIFLFIVFVLQNKWLSSLFVLPQRALFGVILLKSVVALITLFSGIYFFRSNLPKGKNITSPIWVIFMGVCFVILSYGPILLSYKASIELQEPTLKANHIEQLKQIAANNIRVYDDRIIFARMVYVTTGEKVQLLNNNGEVTFFKPNESEMAKRQERVQSASDYKNLLSFSKKTLILQLSILVIFVIGFLLLMKYNDPKLLKINTIKSS